MTTPWKKALADVLQERARAILVVLAIAIGVCCFSAVLSTYAILDREVNRGYIMSNPASATIVSDDFDDQLVTAIEALPGVARAEPRRAVTGQIRTGPLRWSRLVLFVLRDFGDVGISRVVPEEGAWPPGPGEMLVERDAFQVARASIGDEAAIKFPGGSAQTLRITGRVHDVGQAQARMENVVYGYITLDALQGLGFDARFDQLKLLVDGNRSDTKHVRSVVADVSRLVEEHGHPVTRTEIPPGGEHPHAGLMRMFFFAIASFGLFILMLSGILVANLLASLMASQIRQIGVMKTLGGTRAQIARIYYAQALTLGLAAIAVALPLGRWGCHVFATKMARFLNFDIASFAVPPWVDLLVVAVGVVVPLAGAAVPVWRRSGVSIIDTIGDHGTIDGRFGTAAFDRALARIGGRFRPALLAVRNTFRRRGRLVLTMVTLTIAGLFFMTALNVRASLVRTLDVLFGSKKYDLTVVLQGMASHDQIERATRKTPGVSDAEGWIMTSGSFDAMPAAARASDASPKRRGGHQFGASLGDDRFAVLAVPPGTRFWKPTIVEGRGLVPGDTDAIVVNNALAARDPRMKVGNTVSFTMGPAETTWRVVGVAREPFSSAVGYIPRHLFDRLPMHVGTANSIRIVLDDDAPDSVDRVKLDLERNLAAEGLVALVSMSGDEARYGFDQHQLMIYVFLVVVAALIAGVGGLGLATSLSLAVMERRRELGVLRAIGATPRTIRLMVAVEGVTIAVLSWLVALVAATPVSKVTGDLLASRIFRGGLDFHFDPAGPLIWLAVSIVLGVVGGALPAWHANRATVRESLAYE